MTWGVKENAITVLPEGAFPLTHAVTVKSNRGGGAFSDNNDPDKTARQQVLDWCSTNCSLPATIGGYELVCFQNEEDALLFFMTFKR